MIGKIRADRKVRRVTRSLARLYIDLTWIDDPLFMRNPIDAPTSKVRHITKQFSSDEHRGRLWHRWGFVGDAPLLRRYLKQFLQHETEELFAASVHDLACKMLKKGYLEFAPRSSTSSRYEGEVNDVGRIRISQHEGSSYTGGHLSMSAKAYSLPSNDLTHFLSLLPGFFVSYASALVLIMLALLQIIQIARDLGIINWIMRLFA